MRSSSPFALNGYRRKSLNNRRFITPLAFPAKGTRELKLDTIRTPQPLDGTPASQNKKCKTNPNTNSAVLLQKSAGPPNIGAQFIIPRIVQRQNPAQLRTQPLLNLRTQQPL